MDRITFRVPFEIHAELEARAGSQGISEYLRSVLAQQWGREDRHNTLLSEMGSLMARLDRCSVGAASESGPNRDGALMELLLLLRAVAGPDKLRSAQAEVERIGLPVWGSSMFTQR